MYLITGGAGFIGSNYVKFLLKKNEKVVVLDSLTYAGNLNNLAEFITGTNLLLISPQSRLSTIHIDGDQRYIITDHLADEKKRFEFKTSAFGYTQFDLTFLVKEISNIISEESLVFVYGNIVDKALVDTLLPICNTVVNFAAETHVDRSILAPDEFIKTDIYGTYVLLEAARKSQTLNKFIHISTDEVYGVATERSFSEQDPINPRNPYSASKAAADRLVYAYNQTYGLPVNIIRPSNNYGPYQYPEKLVPLIIIKALRDEYLPIYGDGKQIRDWLFVEDTVRAIDLVAKEGKNGEAYNIAGHNERENLDVVKHILRRLGKPEELITHVKDRPGHDRRYSLDDTKIRDELGFKNSGTFEDNLNYTIQWYIDNQNWWQKIIDEDREYKEFIDIWYKERFSD